MSAPRAARRLLTVERVSGLLLYGDGLARQAALAAARGAGRVTDTLLLCEVRAARAAAVLRRCRVRAGHAPRALCVCAHRRAFVCAAP
jgi:hypothetical protein